MTKSELDKQYFPLYLSFLEQLQERLNIVLDTELDLHGDFVDKRVAFGYAVFVIERTRVKRITKEIEDVAHKGFDEMYQLGQLSVLKDAR